MVHTSTAPEGKRQRRRKARTRALLDAAQHVLLTQGEDGLTMAAVAAEADVAVGGIYRYFANKQAMLAALQVRAVHAFGEVLDAALAEGETGDARAQILAAARAWLDFADAHPEAFALLDSSLSDPQANLDEASARAVDGALGPVLVRVEALLVEGVDGGLLSPGDAPLRARVLWAFVHGAAHFRKRERLGHTSARAITEAGIQSLLAGWATGVRTIGVRYRIEDSDSP